MTKEKNPIKALAVTNLVLLAAVVALIAFLVIKRVQDDKDLAESKTIPTVV
jgi:hypothetical protein